MADSSASEEAPVLCDLTEDVATITLNRPSRGNALTLPMVNAILESLARAVASSARVVVLTARGKFFCTGMDLGQGNQSEMRGRVASGDAAQLAIDLYQTIKSCPLPTVAAVNGPAYGGGWGLLFCCDLRLALDSVHFAFTEVKRGIVPAIISAFVVPELGPSRARQFFLTGETVSARRALEVGFLTDVAASPEELQQKTKGYVSQLLENGPRAMAKVKETVAFVAPRPPEETIPFVRRVFEEFVVTSPEARYGMEQFAQKKTPDWRAFRAKL